MNLKCILELLRWNRSKVARLFGIDRATLRRDIDAGKDYVVVNNVVYREIGKLNKDSLKEIERLKLEEQFNSECG